MSSGREIVAAAERGDLQAVRAMVSVDEIADAWWRYMLRVGTSAPEGWGSDPDDWASELWHEEAVLRDEEFARDLLRALAERAPSGADMGVLGAGPVEDFATNELRLRWIEAEAGRSRNFRAALANIYPQRSLSEEQNARLRRAAEVD